MKSYKLIKEYPGSPKLGTIDTKHVNFGYQWISNPQDYSEFWQEIVEKEYEILSFIHNYDDFIFTKKDNGNFNGRYNIGVSLNTLLYTSCKIHSIKRLSDGEVFTIGDILTKYKNTGIKRFYLNRQNQLKVITDANGDGLVANEVSFDLNSIQKAKQLLFKTEDGIDIFEGDNYQIVNVKTFSNYKCIAYTTSSEINFKRFSTKEAAEEYILFNKPCLCINDVLGNQFITVKSCILNLKKLVKSRS